MKPPYLFTLYLAQSRIGEGICLSSGWLMGEWTLRGQRVSFQCPTEGDLKFKIGQHQFALDLGFLGEARIELSGRETTGRRREEQ